jgi:protein TonB
MVRVQPMYPPEAAQQRIEGWVTLSFTISTTGRVKNVKVLASHPSTIFDRAAVKTIRQWKYKPQIRNGERVETSGVKVRLTFELPD